MQHRIVRRHRIRRPGRAVDLLAVDLLAVGLRADQAHPDPQHARYRGSGRGGGAFSKRMSTGMSSRNQSWARLSLSSSTQWR